MTTSAPPSSAKEKKLINASGQRGFTLLEVLVALAILATSLTVVMGTVATSSQQAIYSNKMTRLTELAKSKMVDIEYELMKEGFQEDGQEFDGDFGEVGFDRIEWEAVVVPVKIPPNVEQELKAKVNAQLFGGQKSQGALTGNAAFSEMLPQLIGIVPQMINRIGEKVRRIRLTLHYEFAGKDQTLSLTQYVVSQKTSEFKLFKEGDEAAEPSDFQQ